MLLKDASKTKNNQELVKASIDALVKALESGHSEALSAYLTAMSQFHNYSFQNILLIASQRPTATRVAGIRSWNELGRRMSGLRKRARSQNTNGNKPRRTGKGLEYGASIVRRPRLIKR